MTTQKNVPERIVFRGTVDQLEEAGDYLILLSYVRSLSIGRIMGPLVTIFLAIAGFTQLRGKNMTLFAVYMILTLYVGMTIMRGQGEGPGRRQVQRRPALPDRAFPGPVPDILWG